MRGGNLIGLLGRFAAVGLLNTAVDALLFLVLIRVAMIPVLQASLFSFLVGNLNGFLLHKYWTFRQSSRQSEAARQYVKFLLTSVTILTLHQGCLLIFHFFLQVPDILAKCAGIVLGVGFSFWINRQWVFCSGFKGKKPFSTINRGIRGTALW